MKTWHGDVALLNMLLTHRFCIQFRRRNHAAWNCQDVLPMHHSPRWSSKRARTRLALTNRQHRTKRTWRTCATLICRHWSHVLHAWSHVLRRLTLPGRLSLLGALSSWTRFQCRQDAERQAQRPSYEREHPQQDRSLMLQPAEPVQNMLQDLLGPPWRIFPLLNGMCWNPS